MFLISQRKRTTAPPQASLNLSLCFLCFPSDFLVSIWNVLWPKEKATSLLLFSVPCLLVSFPFGPPAAEVCGNNHPPTVCSLAASPALCMGLFMFLGTDNNLKERRVSSLGMRRCEAACRSWTGDDSRKGGLPWETTTVQAHNKCVSSGQRFGLCLLHFPINNALAIEYISWVRKNVRKLNLFLFFYWNRVFKLKLTWQGDTVEKLFNV